MRVGGESFLLLFRFRFPRGTLRPLLFTRKKCTLAFSVFSYDSHPTTPNTPPPPDGAQGLSCLKRAGVAHRDMSPENLMVHGDNVYIIDLGMCLRIPSSLHDDDDVVPDYDADDPADRYRRDQRQRPASRRRSLILPQTPCGKWYYLSPEVCLSERPFDGPAVDLWAAGVILFVMLTGSPPWEEPRLEDDNFRLMTTGHMGRMLEERVAGLSADAMDLLQSMLFLDPADRLSLEQVRAHPWMTHREHIIE